MFGPGIIDEVADDLVPRRERQGVSRGLGVGAEDSEVAAIGHHALLPENQLHHRCLFREHGSGMVGFSGTY